MQREPIASINLKHVNKPTQDPRNAAYVEFCEPSEARMSYLLSHDMLVSSITVVYMLMSYTVSLYLMATHSSILVGILATLLLTHSMVVALSITHECIHHAVFRRGYLNRITGEISLFITGAIYVPFQELQRQHNEHHASQVGVDSNLVTELLSSASTWIVNIIVPMEACYFPVLSLYAWWRTILIPMWVAKYKRLRGRICVIFVLRCLFFYHLYCCHSLSVVYYFIAHVLFIDIMRVFDAYHHTFDIMPYGRVPPVYNARYEQQATYSTIFGRKSYIHRTLDAIFLNYGYHNAHHFRPKVPWYKLPEMDELMYPQSSVHVIRLPNALKSFHQKRIERICLNGERGYPLPNDQVRGGDVNMDQYIGVIMNISSLVLDVHEYN